MKSLAGDGGEDAERDWAKGVVAGPRLETGPLSAPEAAQLTAFAGKGIGEVLKVFALLISGGFAHPLLPETGDRRPAVALNAEIARRNAAGDAIQLLAAPAIGSAVVSDLVETLIVGELLADRPADPVQLTDHVAAALARTGRNAQRQGQPLADAAEARQEIGNAVAVVLEKRLGLLQTLGICPGDAPG